MALRANSAGGLFRLTRIAASVLIWFGVPLAVGGIVTGPVVIPWLLGGNFQQAGHAFQWVALYVITAPAATLFAWAILYERGGHQSYFLSTCAADGTARRLNRVFFALF